MKINYPEGTFDKDKLMRCETDRILVTPVMVRRGECVGHQLRITNRITVWEWLMWKLGLLR